MEESIRELITLLGKDGLKTAYTLLQSFALWLTLALAVILAVVFIVLKVKKPEMLKKFRSVALGVVIGYAVTLTACISLFMIGRLSVKEEIDKNFYLVLGFLALLLVYAVAALVTAFTGKKAFIICNAVGTSLSVIYGFILLFILPTVGSEYEPLSAAGMYVFSAILIIAIAVPCIIFGKDTGTASPSKALSYAGVSVALSFALSYVKLFSLPQGGSITLASMLPLIIYAYVFGARKGLFAGVVYGILQCLQNPQIYQPMQVLLDYPIAFGALGLAGIAKNLKFLKTPLVKFIFGASLACVGRYLAHLLSGYYVFSSWAMEGYTALSWAVVYNLFIIVELAIILVAGCFLFASKSFVRETEMINPPLAKSDEDDADVVSE